VDLSVCVTDADLEAWRAVRMAVLPYERCSTVEELRVQASPDRLLLIAHDDGVVVGSGLAGRSESADSASVAPRVVPGHRRRGVGSALLEALAGHCETLGVSRVRARVDDEDHLGFATRFGFAEVDREVEQSRATADLPGAPPLPPGVEVVTGAERPGLWEQSFERFGREVLADFAVHTPLDLTAQQWSTSWAGDPMFLAVHGGEVVGCAGLLRDADQPRRAENALTAVRRDWRGRGLAQHLKLRALAWAAVHGVDEVYTWTQDGNAAMRTLNERLGYTTSRTSVSVARPLPLA
jgi:GNAT superfamily N-acetyltransferase